MDAYEKYYDGQKNEHELINRRLTWLLTSQTILFGALAIAVGKDNNVINPNLLAVLARTGTLISFLIWLAITASLLAKFFIWWDYKKENKGTKHQWGVRTWITLMASSAEFLIPWIFIWAWYTVKAVL